MIGYLQVFWEQFNWSALLDTVLRVGSILFCLTVHETAHGLSAYALGDPTAKRMKRLSFNPLHHIDWLGLVALLLCGFGWAKPVPVDMRHFKHPRLGMAVTALAGPISNFLLALALIFGASQLGGLVTVRPDMATPFLLGLFEFLLSTAILSIGLGLFNLVPIPPLDGSKVLFSVLPERAYYILMRLERYGMPLLLLIIWLDLGGQYLTDAITAVYYGMCGLFFGG